MFCPWYPLTEALDFIPKQSGILQIKQKSGLIEYPTGKSAMVLYAFGDDLNKELNVALTGFESHSRGNYMCRHGLEMTGHDRKKFEELLLRFDKRFGRMPLLQEKAKNQVF